VACPSVDSPPLKQGTCSSLRQLCGRPCTCNDWRPASDPSSLLVVLRSSDPDQSALGLGSSSFVSFRLPLPARPRFFSTSTFTVLCANRRMACCVDSVCKGRKITGICETFRRAVTDRLVWRGSQTRIRCVTFRLSVGRPGCRCS
jgi:hypothetical protein